MTPFADAVQIINELTNWIFFTSVEISNNQSIDIIYIWIFTIVVGACIYALANKEA